MEEIKKYGHEYKLLKRLKELGAEYQECYIEWAEKEALYYSEKRVKILQMKANGETATNIQNLIKGVPEVNEALYNMRVAEAYMKAKKEQINILKLEVRHLGLER